MKIWKRVIGSGFLLAVVLAATGKSTAGPIPETPQPPAVSVSLSRLPLSFEPNQGQAAKGVKFLARGTRYTMFLTSNELVLALPTRLAKEYRDAYKRSDSGPTLAHHPITLSHDPIPFNGDHSTLLKMKLLDSNPHPQAVGEHKLPGRSNYFIGSDPSKWRTNISNYSRIDIRISILALTWSITVMDGS